jgi:hypothetical protein
MGGNHAETQIGRQRWAIWKIARRGDVQVRQGIPLLTIIYVLPPRSSQMAGKRDCPLVFLLGFT